VLSGREEKVVQAPVQVEGGHRRVDVFLTNSLSAAEPRFGWRLSTVRSLAKVPSDIVLMVMFI